MLTYNKIYSEIKNQKSNQQTFFCKNSIANWIAASWSYEDKNVLLLSIKVPLNMSRYFCRRLYFPLANTIFFTKVKLIENYPKFPVCTTNNWILTSHSTKEKNIIFRGWSNLCKSLPIIYVQMSISHDVKGGKIWLAFLRFQKWK